MGLKTSWESLKSTWNGLTPKKKLLVGGGAVVVLLLLATAEGGQRNAPFYNQPNPNGPYAGGPGQGGPYQGGPYQEGGPYQGGPYQGGPYQGAAYPNAGYQGGAPAGGGDADPTGYWARQRSQDQLSQARSQAMLDNSTIQGQDGTVYNNVPNEYANPAIEAGVAAPVATADLPTSYDAPAASSSE